MMLCNKFQTPIDVCHYMSSLVPHGCSHILEPTPGVGNLKNILLSYGYNVTSPEDFFLLPSNSRFDCVVMNPPFSEKSALLQHAPSFYQGSGMKVGYYILQEAMNMSDHVIALMPWFTISDSDVRLRCLLNFGLQSVTLLERKTFNYTRIQTCILVLSKGFRGTSSFQYFSTLIAADVAKK